LHEPPPPLAHRLHRNAFLVGVGHPPCWSGPQRTAVRSALAALALGRSTFAARGSSASHTHR
jgi:hypothetical protein